MKEMWADAMDKFQFKVILKVMMVTTDHYYKMLSIFH